VRGTTSGKRRRCCLLPPVGGMLHGQGARSLEMHNETDACHGVWPVLALLAPKLIVGCGAALVSGGPVGGRPLADGEYVGSSRSFPNGATNSSNVIMNAVENALRLAERATGRSGDGLQEAVGRTASDG